MSGGEGFYGQNGPTDHISDHNTLAFMIAQQIKAVNTATICKVMKCSNTGTVDKIGTVDVLPLVDMQDGIGRTSKHVNIQKIPYLRMQGGSKAIIMDPKEGDLALVVFADRDTSAVRKNKKQSAPGSKRHHNMADGMYVGTLLADAPTSYVRFGDDGSIYVSPDNGTTLWRLKAGEVYATPDNGTTTLTMAPGTVTVKSTTIVLDELVKLGGADASKPVSAQGTVDSAGDIDASNFLTKVLGK